MIQELESGRHNHLPLVKAQHMLSIIVIIHGTVSSTQSGLDGNKNNIKENQRGKNQKACVFLPYCCCNKLAQI